MPSDPRSIEKGAPGDSAPATIAISPGWGRRLAVFATCLRHFMARRIRTGTKRALDIAGSSLLLALASPALLATALAILLTDGRPVLFSQRRVGRGGRLFSMMKFRTMRRNSERVQNLSAQKHKLGGASEFFVDPEDERIVKLQRTLMQFSREQKYPKDPRVLPVGRFIRKFSIDELPQLFQILQGHMSFVGPRPFVPYEVALYSPRGLMRHVVKPGLTGLWQVSDRGRLQQDEAIGLDLKYVARQGLALDLHILVKTVPAALGGNRGGN